MLFSFDYLLCTCLHCGLKIITLIDITAYNSLESNSAKVGTRVIREFNVGYIYEKYLHIMKMLNLFLGTKRTE